MENSANSTEIKAKPGYATYRTIDIHIEGDALRGFGMSKIIWGTDIWVNNVPILKLIVAANILVWVLLFVLGR